MSELPSGTVTFLFTDIEGSTPIAVMVILPNTDVEHTAHAQNGSIAPNVHRTDAAGAHGGTSACLRTATEFGTAPSADSGMAPLDIESTWGTYARA